MQDQLRRAGALAALLAGAYSTSVAAAGPRLADPADPGAPVPATRYASREFPARASVATPSPSQHWKALNQVVASYDSMSLTSDMADAVPAQGAAVDANAPAPSSAPPAATDPHAHHKSGTTK